MSDLRDRPEQWPVHEVEEIWDGKAPFSVRRDLISAPADPDERFGRLVLEHPGAVVVLAVDEQERALVLRQYRHPVHQRLVELPAGLLDKPDEDPRVAAERELREEALLLAGEWTHLLTTYSSPGLTSERLELFLARDLSEAPDRGDGFELHHEEADMTSEWVPVAELLAGFLDGRLADGPLGHAVMTYVLGGHSARSAG
ncbi:NUDIX domain-containing protein [Nocardioides mesophilus]|uniref:NUDIX hydrolase n=1 Tax=Nocardioides mesophilus TaxID=433659 RepID=A0A7G9RAJ7_9ACTN|nr:NUDIX hydrolase [Nocardioides mesophilus]QNN52622.1 NUDIX hydrolase [Nocardioides mesophilus]